MKDENPDPVTVQMWNEFANNLPPLPHRRLNDMQSAFFFALAIASLRLTQLGDKADMVLAAVNKECEHIKERLRAWHDRVEADADPDWEDHPLAEWTTGPGADGVEVRMPRWMGDTQVMGKLWALFSAYQDRGKAQPADREAMVFGFVGALLIVGQTMAEADTADEPEDLRELARALYEDAAVARKAMIRKIAESN